MCFSDNNHRRDFSKENLINNNNDTQSHGFLFGGFWVDLDMIHQRNKNE